MTATRTANFDKIYWHDKLGRVSSFKNSAEFSSMLNWDGISKCCYWRLLLSSSDSLVVSFPDLSSGLG